MRYGRLFTVLAVLLISTAFTGCSRERMIAAEVSQMKVSSDNLQNGIWDTKITDTKNGSNVSPELKWEKVEGAEEYAIYMVDPTAHNWLHWKACGIKATELAEGAVIDDSQYVGPYPPSGTHTYTVYVYALKAQADSFEGRFDSANKDISVLRSSLDISGGQAGNIIAEGSISGTYTSGK